MRGGGRAHVRGESGEGSGGGERRMKGGGRGRRRESQRGPRGRRGCGGRWWGTAEERR